MVLSIFTLCVSAFACRYMHMYHMHAVPQRQKERVRYPRPEVIGCCELSQSVWEPNPGPLKEQNLPLISEPPPISPFICISRNWFYNPSRISPRFKAIHYNIFYKSKRQKNNQKQHQQEGEQWITTYLLSHWWRAKYYGHFKPRHVLFPVVTLNWELSN